MTVATGGRRRPSIDPLQYVIRALLLLLLLSLLLSLLLLLMLSLLLLLMLLFLLLRPLNFTIPTLQT